MPERKLKMFKKLRIKMVIYNMIIISSILIIITATILAGSPEIRAATQDNSSLMWVYIFRVTFVLIIILALVFLGSYMISGNGLLPIKKAWQRQIDFTADASHELRTPLASIQANVELIKGNRTETVESQMQWINNIGIETARMARLVDDLLFLSRSDVGHTLIDKSNFMLDVAITEAVSSLLPSAAAKKQYLDSLIEPDILFYGDRDKLKRLAIILLDNAIKYTPEKGRITCKLSKTGKEVLLAVKDTGIGVDKGSKAKIFERFYRSDKARSRSNGGNGLGLSIAKCIVEEHKGTIGIDSELGKGAEFIVRLPC